MGPLPPRVSRPDCNVTEALLPNCYALHHGAHKDAASTMDRVMLCSESVRCVPTRGSEKPEGFGPASVGRARPCAAAPGRGLAQERSGSIRAFALTH